MNPITTLKKLIKSKPYVDEIEKDVNNMQPSNWRTTVNGVLSAVFALGAIWIPSSNTKLTATMASLGALFAALGLYHAGDKQNLK